jgi:fibronectin-binding autotransporter adhesin
MGKKQSRVCLNLACAATPVVSLLAGNLLFGTGEVRGSAYWSGGTGNWNDATWVLDGGNTVPPGNGQVAAAQAGPVIVGVGNNGNVTFTGPDVGMRAVYIGYAAGNNFRPNPGTAVLNVTGPGAINTSQDMVWGDGASGILNINGGILSIGGDSSKHIIVGATADFTVNLSSGNLWLPRYGLENGGGAFSTLNMTGGNLEFKTAAAYPTTALVDNAANTVNVDDFNFAGGTLGGALGTGGGISNVTIQRVSGSGSIAFRKNAASIVTFDLASTSTWAGVMGPGGNNTATTGDGILAKQGVGDLTITAVQQFRREVRPQGGLLTFNYAGNGTGMIHDDASIALSGGTLRLLGDAGGTSELIGGDTSRNSLRAVTGGSTLLIDRNGSTFNLDVRGSGATNDIGRSVGGVANVALTSGTLGSNVNITIIAAGTNGVIKGWTVNDGTEFATNDLSGGTFGNLVPFTAYSADTDLGTSTAGSTGTMKPTGPQTVITTPVTFNGINLTGSVGIAMSGAGALELSSGSLIGNTTGSITGGTLTVRAPTVAPTSPVPSDIIIHTAKDLTISSNIIDNSDPNSPVALTKGGTATLTISGTNTYSNATYIAAGTVKLGSAGALPLQTAVTLSNTPGAILDLNGNGVGLGGLTGGGPNGGEVKLNGANLVLTTTTLNTYSGTLSGNGGVSYVGNFDVTLAGSSSTYTGATTLGNVTLYVAGLADGGQPSSIGAASTAASNLVINGGTLRSAGRVVSSTNRLFTVGPNGATLFGGGNNVANVGTFSPLRFTGTGTLGMSGAPGPRTLTLTSGTTGPSNTNARERAFVAMENLLTPVIPDSGVGSPTSVTKNGIGVWYLAGLNTYTGATNINVETTAGLVDQPSVLRVNTLKDGGLASSIGASGSGPSNLVLNGNAAFPVQLQYVGAGNTTNREFTANGLAQLDASGTGPIVFSSTADISGAPTTLTLTGTNTGANTLKMGIPTGALAKTGPGQWVLQGNLAYAGATTVTGPLDAFGGILRLETNLTTTSAVTATSSTLVLAANGSLVASRIIKTGTVNATAGKIDIGDGKLIATGTSAGTWTGSNYTGMTAMVATGRNGNVAPIWDGTVGIVTSQSLATGGNYTSVGVATASDVRPATASETAMWGGQTITGTDTLVMYTYGGDATLDGKINIDDYVKIDSGIAGSYTGWANGDFNYDGKVSIDDYITVIDANIGNQNGIFPTASGGPASAGLGGVSAVPEPAGFSILALSTIGLLRRSRRTRKAQRQRRA